MAHFYNYEKFIRFTLWPVAGPDISVAMTKAYSAQLAAADRLAVQMAYVWGTITEEQYSHYISELVTLLEKMGRILEDKERTQWFASKYANAHDVFFVGHGIDYAVGLEGSLTQSNLYEKTISNMVKRKSRGDYLVGLTTFGKYETEDQIDFTIYVLKVDEHFVGRLVVLPLQLL